MYWNMKDNRPPSVSNGLTLTWDVLKYRITIEKSFLILD